MKYSFNWIENLADLVREIDNSLQGPEYEIEQVGVRAPRFSNELQIP